MVRVAKRAVAFAFVALAFAGWMALTTAALATTPKEESAHIDYAAPTEWLQLSPADLAAVGYFRVQTCGDCHSGGSRVGPRQTGVRLSLFHKRCQQAASECASLMRDYFL
jgi:hypothetical protein